MTTSLRLKNPIAVSPPSHLEGLSSVVATYIDQYLRACNETPAYTGLYDLILGEVERPLLSMTLKATHGNQKKAAEILGINRNTLKRKLDEYGIDPSDL